jgi:hypothetical protein
VVAASTDPVERARETVTEHSLAFPVGYGLPVKETAATLGPSTRSAAGSSSRPGT